MGANDILKFVIDDRLLYRVFSNPPGLYGSKLSEFERQKNLHYFPIFDVLDSGSVSTLEPLNAFWKIFFASVSAIENCRIVICRKLILSTPLMWKTWKRYKSVRKSSTTDRKFSLSSSRIVQPTKWNVAFINEHSVYTCVSVRAHVPDVCVNIRVEFVAVYQNWKQDGKKILSRPYYCHERKKVLQQLLAFLFDLFAFFFYTYYAGVYIIVYMYITCAYLNS